MDKLGTLSSVWPQWPPVKYIFYRESGQINSRKFKTSIEEEVEHRK